MPEQARHDGIVVGAGPNGLAAAITLARAAPSMWVHGEAHTVHAWIQALPDAVLRQHARFALDAARHFLNSLHAVVKASYASGQAQVAQTITRVEGLLRRQQESSARTDGEAMPEAALLMRRIRLLRALIVSRALLTRGDVEGMRHLAQETEALAAEEDISWKMIALSIAYWFTESLQREGGLLIPRLLEAKNQAIAGGDRLATASSMRMLTFGYVRAGRWRQVEHECLNALALMEQIGEQSATQGYLHYLLSLTCYAWNRLEAAMRKVQQVIQIAQTWQQADLLIAGEVSLAEFLGTSGDLAAEQDLQTAEALVQQERFATHAPWVLAAWVQHWLATGNLSAASDWAGRAVFSPETWDPNRKWEFLLLVRVYLAQQQYDKAIAALGRFAPLLDRPGDIATATHFLALQIVALHGAGQSEQARAVAARLLALAAPEGNVRVFLDARALTQPVLERLRDAPPDGTSLPADSLAFVSHLLTALEMEAQHKAQRKGTTGTAGWGALTEPLTQREEEVLRLLVAGASNQEIAAKLVISMATVKKHVGNIFSKLGVQTRVQAITLARDWPEL